MKIKLYKVNKNLLTLYNTLMHCTHHLYLIHYMHQLLKIINNQSTAISISTSNLNTVALVSNLS